jgi:hypothetical protein
MRVPVARLNLFGFFLGPHRKTLGLRANLIALLRPYGASGINEFRLHSLQGKPTVPPAPRPFKKGSPYLHFMPSCLLSASHKQPKHCEGTLPLKLVAFSSLSLPQPTMPRTLGGLTPRLFFAVEGGIVWRSFL